MSLSSQSIVPASRIAAGSSLLQIRDLHAHYGKSHILQGVSFDVGHGEVISLLGRNGSGRSTTARAIMGLVPPSAGQVLLKWPGSAGCAAVRGVPGRHRVCPRRA